MNTKNSTGFTIIEVLIAIVILAGSVVVLLSLETAAIARSINDRQHFHASLAARSLMSSLELQEKIDNQETNKPLLEILEDYNAFGTINDYTQRIYEQMEAALIVEEIDLSGLLGAASQAQDNDQQAAVLKLQKLSLGIRWGMGEEQNLSIYYAKAQ